MRTHSRSLALSKIFAVLFVLLLSAQVSFAAEGSEAPETTVTTAEAAPTMETAPEVASTPAASCSAKAEKTFDSVTQTANSWKVEASASCQYSCPNGMVMLCPEISGYTKSCVNDCCVYC